jgi:hypothetical protein
MPRPHEHASVLHGAVHGLVQSITHLIDRLRDAVAAAPADVPGEALSGTAGRRGPGKGNLKLKSALKASWARMTPAQRKARVKKMLAGRGLTPKRAKAAHSTKKKPASSQRAGRKRATAPQAEVPVPPTIVI